MKRRKLTFTVITTEVSDNGERVWEKTARYSSMRHLIITRAINAPGYNITHVMSGKSVSKGYPKLALARKALDILLPMADWRQEEEAYMGDHVLRDRVADVYASIAIIT